MRCPSCNAENPDDARTCTSCGSPLPVSLVETAEVAVARLRDRAFAAVLDMVVIGAVYVVVGSWVAGRWGGLTAQGFELHGKPALIAVGITSLAGFLYYWILEATTGATIGKAALGIGVRGTSSGGIGIGPSLVRNAARLIDAIGGQ
ncbi:MAG: RDD family protein [Gemmatimonadaceae bacterium]